jgi:hypothetical protein
MHVEGRNLLMPYLALIIENEVLGLCHFIQRSELVVLHQL